MKLEDLGGLVVCKLGIFAQAVTSIWVRHPRSGNAEGLSKFVPVSENHIFQKPDFKLGEADLWMVGRLSWLK